MFGLRMKPYAHNCRAECQIRNLAGARIVQVGNRPVGVRAEDNDLITWLNVGNNLLHFRLPSSELPLIANLESAHLGDGVLHQGVSGNGSVRLKIERMRLGRRPLRADYPQCRVVHLDAPPRVAAFPERMNTGSVGRHLRRQRPMATRRRGDRGDSEHQNHEYGPESQGRSAGRKSMCHGHPHRGRESRGPQPREPGAWGDGSDSER